MPHVMTMAAIVAGAQEAAIASWSVAVGDRVGPGDPIAEVETEKALVDLVADAEGTVAHLVVPAGAAVAVGAPVLVLRQDGDSAEAVEEAVHAVGVATDAGPAQGAVEVAAAKNPGPAEAEESPAERDVPAHAENRSGRPFVSPLARAIAREAGIDPRAIRGSGPGGRVLRADVERAVREARAGGPDGRGLDDGRGDLVPLTNMRATIARRLSESKQTVPHFYVQGDVNAGRLVELHGELKAAGARVSLNDLIVKAVAIAHQRVPAMNTIYTAEGLRRYRTSDIGLAVALEDGIVVPVLRGVDRLTVGALADHARSLADRARSGGLRADELAGGTITVSNLGMFGVRNFAAIINPPHAAILAVGAAREDVVVEAGQVVAGRRMAFTLAVDHRAVDGAIAAAWVAEFTSLLENPAAILV